MKFYDWNPEKNAKLRRERGIGFEEVVFHLEHHGALEVLEHPRADRYPGQRIFIVWIESYAWLVPFVETDESLFLKTLFPSRQATKKYLARLDHDEEG